MEHAFETADRVRVRQIQVYVMYQGVVHALSVTHLEEEFETFVEQHSAQWMAEGRPGHFGAWPRALEFNRELVRTQGALGRVRFSRILADDKVVSNQYVFAFGDSYFWELPARAMGPKWDRLSLGPAGVIFGVQ